MMVLTSARPLRRLAAVLVMIAASMLATVWHAAPAQATTGCEPTVDVPHYNSYTHWAEAAGHVNCGGYYELKLLTSGGATLAKQSGYYVSPLTVYTTWVTCPSGTNVRSYLYEKANVQGNTYTYTVTSAYFLCP